MLTINMICEDDSLKPEIATEGSAGFDLKLSSDILIPVGAVFKVGTGLKLEIPKGYMGLVTPRSSTKNLELTNTVGIIDSDYRGEIFLSILNTGDTTYLGYKGDRLFQLIIIPTPTVSPNFVETFSSNTNRGSGGFGSTGK